MHRKILRDSPIVIEAQAFALLTIVALGFHEVVEHGATGFIAVVTAIGLAGALLRRAFRWCRAKWLIIEEGIDEVRGMKAWRAKIERKLDDHTTQLNAVEKRHPVRRLVDPLIDEPTRESREAE